jgi:hypothetical protein
MNDYHDKLNQFSRYLSERMYVYNNDLKITGICGYQPVDFEPLTIQDVLFNVPKNIYMGAVFQGDGKDGEFVLQLIFQEYSLMRSDYEIELIAGNEFASILQDIKSMLTGDKITVNYKKEENYKIYRDNFSQNGKVRTVFSQSYIVSFN